MRISCNGCRVLRKGCSDDCIIRPCIEWIKTPQAQENATLFMAKFYGRTGLNNLLSAGPQHLRPGIFKSLLHDACGRIVNPAQGSVGLLFSGNWHLCRAAVQAVLNGTPIEQLPEDSDACATSDPIQACDIRHVTKKEVLPGGPAADVLKLRPDGHFKRAGEKTRPKPKPKPKPKAKAEAEQTDGTLDVNEVARLIMSLANQKGDAWSSGQSHFAELVSCGGESGSEGPQTVEEAAGDEPAPNVVDVDLDLTLGLGSAGTRVGDNKYGAHQRR